VIDVLAGDAGPVVEIPWGAAAATCDSFSATVGDRLVVAVRATGFGRTMYPYWPIRQAEVRPGARDDLLELQLALRRNPVEYGGSSLLLMMGIGLALLGGLAVYIRGGWRKP